MKNIKAICTFLQNLQTQVWFLLYWCLIPANKTDSHTCGTVTLPVRPPACISISQAYSSVSLPRGRPWAENMAWALICRPDRLRWPSLNTPQLWDAVTKERICTNQHKLIWHDAFFPLTCNLWPRSLISLQIFCIPDLKSAYYLAKGGRWRHILCRGLVKVINSAANRI